MSMSSRDTTLSIFFIFSDHSVTSDWNSSVDSFTVGSVVLVVTIGEEVEGMILVVGSGGSESSK